LAPPQRDAAFNATVDITVATAAQPEIEMTMAEQG
jgi:hypothetical protein